LLDDNRSLSIAFLSRRIQDLERDVRERFLTLDRSREKRMAENEEAVETLKGRLQVAGVKFRELQNEVDKLKEAAKAKTKPPPAT